MLTFKSFLQTTPVLKEHKVYGEFSGSADNRYKVILSEDKASLFLIPYDGNKETTLTYTFDKKAVDAIEGIIEKSKGIEKPEYPKSWAIKELELVSKILMDGIQLKGSLLSTGYNFIDNLPKEFILNNVAADLLYHVNIFTDSLDTFPNSPRSLRYSFLALEYLVIDIKEKRIYLEQKGKEHHIRIGTLTTSGNQSDTQYVVPISGGNINSSRLILKILQSLRKNISGFDSYMYVNTQTSNNETLTVKDVLNGIGELAQQSGNYDKIFSRRGTIKAYHGTDYDSAMEIMKRGLKPGLGLHYYDKIKGHSDKNVYLTTSLPDARKYAVRASGSYKAAVLEVTISDYDKLMFDEDTLFHALDAIPEKVLSEIKYRFFSAAADGRIEWPFGTREDAFYSNNLDIEDLLLRHTDIKSMYEKDLPDDIRNLLNHIGSYGFKGHKTFTFAYRGYIRKNNVKMVETFESTTYNDNKPETYAKLYDKVVASITRY